MTIIEDRNNALANISLSSGSHDNAEDGMCAMEAVAWITGEPFSDRPKCVSPAIGAFMRAWNDALPDDETRDRLIKPLLETVIGTAGTIENEIERAWIANDWVVRIYTPAWLRLAGLNDQADLLEGMPELTPETEPKLIEPIKAVMNDASAAYSAAASAADSAAYSAARSAAASAADSAAYSAAHSAAYSAAASAAHSALEPSMVEIQSTVPALIQRLVQVGR